MVMYLGIVGKSTDFTNPQLQSRSNSIKIPSMYAIKGEPKIIVKLVYPTAF